MWALRIEPRSFLQEYLSALNHLAISSALPYYKFWLRQRPHKSDWPQISYIIEAGFELLIFLPLTASKYWDYRYVPLWSALLLFLFFGGRGLLCSPGWPWLLVLLVLTSQSEMTSIYHHAQLESTLSTDNRAFLTFFGGEEGSVSMVYSSKSLRFSHYCGAALLMWISTPLFPRHLVCFPC